jgi:DNA-binding NtrC family response regulator
MAKQAILCVDDEKIILDSLKTQLKQHYGSKYSYEVAESASDAMEIIEEMLDEGTEVLVVVSDWLMPGIKGDEFLIALHEKHPGVVKVMLTGQADDEAINRARDKANLHRCLYKPWSAEDLFETIETGLEHP